MVLLFAYAGTATPLFVVESNSMQHGSEESRFGVLDTGDVFIAQAVRSRSDVITYLEGRATGYSTYGDFGDVIVFPEPGGPPVPFVHRAMAYVRWNETAKAFDVEDLALLDDAEWDAWDANGVPTDRPFGISQFVLHGAGWRRDLDIYFNLTRGERSLVVGGVGAEGFLTMGDNNAYTTLTKVDRWVVPASSVLARARGEIPWFGLLRLTLFPSEQGCCEAWGSTDPERGAPANSWTSLTVSLGLLIGTPAALAILDFYLGRHPEARARWRARWRRLFRRTLREKPIPPSEPAETGNESRVAGRSASHEDGLEGQDAR